jgi:hypothetical protein
MAEGWSPALRESGASSSVPSGGTEESSGSFASSSIRSGHRRPGSASITTTYAPGSCRPSPSWSRP